VAKIGFLAQGIWRMKPMVKTARQTTIERIHARRMPVVFRAVDNIAPVAVRNDNKRMKNRKKMKFTDR
jgi:hypothetical protein